MGDPPPPPKAVTFALDPCIPRETAVFICAAIRICLTKNGGSDVNGDNYSFYPALWEFDIFNTVRHFGFACNVDIGMMFRRLHSYDLFNEYTFNGYTWESIIHIGRSISYNGSQFAVLVGADLDVLLCLTS